METLFWVVFSVLSFYTVSTIRFSLKAAKRYRIEGRNDMADWLINIGVIIPLAMLCVVLIVKILLGANPL